MSFKKPKKPLNLSLLGRDHLNNIADFLPNTDFKKFRSVNKQIYISTENQRTKRFMRPYSTYKYVESLPIKDKYAQDVRFINDQIVVILCKTSIVLWNIETNQQGKISIPDKYRGDDIIISLAVSDSYLAIAYPFLDHSETRIHHYTIQVYELNLSTLTATKLCDYQDKAPNTDDIDEEHNEVKVAIYEDYIIYWNYDVRIINFKTRDKVKVAIYEDLQNVGVDKKRKQIAILYEGGQKIDFIRLKCNDIKKIKTINAVGKREFNSVVFNGDIMVLIAYSQTAVGCMDVGIYHYSKSVTNFIKKREITLPYSREIVSTISIIPNDYVIVFVPDDNEYITILDASSGKVIQQIYIGETCPIIACNALGKIAFRDSHICTSQVIRVLHPIDNNDDIGKVIKKLVDELHEKFRFLQGLSYSGSQYYYTSESYKQWRHSFDELYTLFQECGYCSNINFKISQELLFKMVLFLQSFIKLERLPLKDVLNLPRNREKWETEMKNNTILLFKYLDQTVWHIPWYLYRKYPRIDFYKNLCLGCEKKTFTYKFILGMSTNYNCHNNEARYFFLKAGLFYVLDGYKKAIQYYTEGLKVGPNLMAYYHRGGAYYQEGQFKNAILDFTTVIQSNLPTKRLNSHFYRAKAYFYVEKFEYETGAINYCIEDLKVVLLSNSSNDLRNKIKKFLKKACDLTRATHLLMHIKLLNLYKIFFDESIPNAFSESVEKLKKKIFQKNISKW